MAQEFLGNFKENNMSLETNLSGFDVAEVRENEAGYNYYGFAKADGSWKILREKTDSTEYRFAVGREDFETAFAARATLTYKAANHLPRV
jgi:hypothetical protein